MERTCCSKRFFSSTAAEAETVQFLAVRLQDLPLMLTTTGCAMVFVPLPRAVYSY
jgi:hypothetical protein